jgi:hypothetical protein
MMETQPKPPTIAELLMQRSSLFGLIGAVAKKADQPKAEAPVPTEAVR